MDNTLKKEDYELYKIHFPVKMLLERKRNSFFYSELEKRHPCFSSLCAFDYKIKLGRKGLESDVIVMNRLKLAEVKKHTGFRGILIPEAKKRFFISRKYKRVIVFLMLLFFSMLFIFCSLLFRENSSDSVLMDSEIENSVIPENQNSDLENIESVNEYVNLEKEFFDVVNLSGGKIDSFKWKLSDEYESVNASVENIYPEELDKINSDYLSKSKIIYKASVPFFSFEANKKLPVPGKPSSGSLDFTVHELPEETGFLEKIRGQFLDFSKQDVCLLEENPENLEFIFLLGKNISTAKEFFENVDLLCRECGFFVSGFTLEKSDDKYFNVRLSFCKESGEVKKGSAAASFAKYSFLEDLIYNLELLGFIKIEETRAVTTPQYENKEPADEFEKLKKIGEVRYKNGRQIIYYKNTEGKIISVEK